jgi:hypothetical protein
MGALPLHPDPRDWQTRDDPAVQAMLPKAPESFSLLDYYPGQSYDQDGTGACTCASTTGVCSTNTKHFGDGWHLFNWNALYREAGGTGSNGVDSRTVLEICRRQGTPLAAGGREMVVASYDFVTQQPNTFREEIKAAIALGFPVVIACLLPSDFGWQSGQPNAAVTQGYHQIEGLGYDPTYVVILNSWGNGWPGAGAPKPGIGSIRWDYLEASNLQNRYCYAYRVTPKDATPTPPPAPLTISGYTPNPVKAGQPLTVSGTGFDAGPAGLMWQGFTLPAGTVSATAIQTTAPSPPGTQTGPVVVTVGQKALSGPALTVTVDPGPGPGPGPQPPPAVQVTGSATGADVGKLVTGKEYLLTGLAASVLFATISEVGPAPGKLTVSGYSPTTVSSGQSFVILGEGFKNPGSLTVLWGTMTVPATLVTDTQIAATAPVGASGANPVTVSLGAQNATGPILTITADGGGGDGGGGNQAIKVMLSTKGVQLRNTLSVVCYTSDANGGSYPASVNGRVTGQNGAVDLWGMTTHGTQGPAIWTVPRPAPWGVSVDVVVHAANAGNTGTGRATG